MHYIVIDYSHVDVASTSIVKMIHILCLLQTETLDNLVEEDFFNLCQYGEYDACKFRIFGERKYLLV
jgi:hypothetical protein